jgi:hypothetical protein
MNARTLIFFLIASITSFSLYSQKVEKIEVPNGVVYNYCKPKVYEESKEVIRRELTQDGEYSLVGRIMFVGPVLWGRYQEIESLKNIAGGNTTLMVDDKKLSAKLTQNVDDGKKVWDALRQEIGKRDFKLRKATKQELEYYWSVISFDIDEPLVIVETGKEKYILNISPKTMTLLWLDQVPF